MESISPSIRRLARSLLDSSHAKDGAQTERMGPVAERLRISVTQFAGTHGFAALLRRAVALATAEMPALRCITVSVDGRLDGLEELGAQGKSVSDEAALVLTTHVLALLVTFIGEPLTLKLVRQGSRTSVEAPTDE